MTHLKSEDHLSSVAALDMNQQAVSMGLQAASEKSNNAALAALRTVYWVVTEELANKKYAYAFSFTCNCYYLIS